MTEKEQTYLDNIKNATHEQDLELRYVWGYLRSYLEHLPQGPSPEPGFEELKKIVSNAINVMDRNDAIIANNWDAVFAYKETK